MSSDQTVDINLDVAVVAFKELLKKLGIPHQVEDLGNGKYNFKITVRNAYEAFALGIAYGEYKRGEESKPTPEQEIERLKTFQDTMREVFPGMQFSAGFGPKKR